MRACNSGERASSGRNTREEVPVGSAAADAAKSEHACRIRLARRAMSHHFPGVLAVLEAQSGSSQGGRLDSRTNFRKQLVAAIRPRWASCAWKRATGASPWIRSRRRSHAGWSVTMRGGTHLKQFAPIWSRFLASRSCTARRPGVRRFEEAGCVDSIAVLRRFGYAYQDIGRRAWQCSLGPVGRFRARRHGSVARVPDTLEPFCSAEKRPELPSPWGGLRRPVKRPCPGEASRTCCGREMDAERRAGMLIPSKRPVREQTGRGALPAHERTSTSHASFQIRGAIRVRSLFPRCSPEPAPSCSPPPRSGPLLALRGCLRRLDRADVCSPGDLQLEGPQDETAYGRFD